MKATGLKIAVASALTAAGAAVLPVVGAAVPAQAATASRIVVTCGGSGVSRPAGIIVTCRTAATFVMQLKWSSWAATATATGTAMINNCKPTCRRGTFRIYAVKITLERPLAWQGHVGRSYYSKLSMTFTGSAPTGAAKTVVYALPSHATM